MSTGPGTEADGDDGRVGAVDAGAADAGAADAGAVEVDARGRRCPLPVIALARAARGLGAGSVLTLLATDPATRHDVPAWCRMRGHVLVSAPSPPSPSQPQPRTPAVDGHPADPEDADRSAGPEVLRFVVRLGPAPPS